MRILVILLLAVIAGGGYAAWNEIQSKTTALDELETKNSDLTKEIELLKKQSAALEEAKSEASERAKAIEKENCKGIWSDETGCAEPQVVFSMPTGEETFCFGKPVDVKWDSSLVQSEEVNLMLATSSNSGKLATIANAGEYTWKLESPHKPTGGGAPFTIAPGMYRLRIQNAEGKLLGKDTELFTVKKCDGGGAKPAKGKKPVPAKKKK